MSTDQMFDNSSSFPWQIQGSVSKYNEQNYNCGQPKAHLCNNHAVWSASWYATPVRWIDYLGKGEVLTQI